MDHYDIFKWAVMDNQYTFNFKKGYCDFCDRFRKCYYNKEFCCHYGYYELIYHVCSDTFNEILVFKKCFDVLCLLNNLLDRYLCQDMKNIIIQLIFEDREIKCITMKNKKNEKRKNYLEYDFTSLSTEELKVLMQNRNLSYKHVPESQYHRILKEDMADKKLIWL